MQMGAVKDIHYSFIINNEYFFLKNSMMNFISRNNNESILLDKILGRL